MEKWTQTNRQFFFDSQKTIFDETRISSPVWGVELTSLGQVQVPELPGPGSQGAEGCAQGVWAAAARGEEAGGPW